MVAVDIDRERIVGIVRLPKRMEEMRRLQRSVIIKLPVTPKSAGVYGAPYCCAS